MCRSILSGAVNSIPHSRQTVSVTVFSLLKRFISALPCQDIKNVDAKNV